RGAQGARAPREDLWRLAGRELRAYVRGALPDAVHAEIPPHHRRQHEHRLAGAAALQAEPGGGSARRGLSVGAEHSLHHALPLSDSWRVRVLFEEIRAEREYPSEPRAGIGGSATQG